MNIGFMGLGKLGLPCALAVENAGHTVVGYDPDTSILNTLATKVLPYREEGADALLSKTKIKVVSVAKLVSDCDLIFVAVQTPHDPMYEGITRLPEKRVDFNYSYLKDAIKQISTAAQEQNKLTRVIIISTVLPGTVDREVRPLLNDNVKLCYNPFFIAMGTTVHDFTHPEFVLFGVDDAETATLAENFYRTIHDRQFYKTTIKNAELIKVSYNTFISTKIAFVNTLMEICHKTGCDVDAVTDALKLANERLISEKYLTAGMGDGGGCHPRDNIALSWLAKKIDMKFDFFEAIMLSREKQTDWFVDVIKENLKDSHEVIILGEAFKPETNLTTGSPSKLLLNILVENNIKTKIYDPVINGTMPKLEPALYFIGTKHDIFKEIQFPAGSVVIDPHRYIADQQSDVKLIKLGSS